MQNSIHLSQPIELAAKPATEIVSPHPRDTSDLHPITLDLGIVSLTIAIPLAIVASVLGYRRYRRLKLKQYIAHLEKIWQLSDREMKS